MTDHKTVSVYDSQAHNYADFIKQQPVDALLLDFIARFKKNDYVLDLGCGPALSSATMREHGLRVDPIDASGEMVKLANNTFNIGARQGLFEDLDRTGNNTYDGVWANFSLLHATPKDLPSILKMLHQVLKPSGVFHMAMKVGQGSTRDKLDRYYSYYSNDELHIYLGEAGFIVDSVVLGEALGLAGKEEPWIVLTSFA